jgi:hypothetical protein
VSAWRRIIDDRSAVGGGEHSTGSVCVNCRRTYFAARHIARVGQSYLINIHLIVVGEWRILASVASGLASRAEYSARNGSGTSGKNPVPLRPLRPNSSVMIEDVRVLRDEFVRGPKPRP